MKLSWSDPAIRIATVYVVAAVAYFGLAETVVLLAGLPAPLFTLPCAIIWSVFIATTTTTIVLERRRSDREARYAESILRSAEAAFIGADVDGIISSWNLGAQKLYGYTADEARGQSVAILLPEDRRPEIEYILDMVRTGEPIRGFETIRRRKDGKEVHISLIVSPVHDSAGEIVGYSSIAHDVTSQKRAHRALQMAEVGQLASGLVHEIRNPLNAMRMQIAVIQDSLEAPEPDDIELAKEQLGRLEGEVLRVQELANNFLAYGRPAREKPDRIDVAELLKAVVEFVRFEFEKVHTRIHLQLDSGGKPLVVVMDRDMLRQILVNIAENARQAMSPGHSLTITCDRGDNGGVRIRMSDTGCGIEREQLPRIFDAFYSTKEHGTGLGLAIVKKTVEAAGGAIRAESAVGEGTTIEITLPAVDESPLEPALSAGSAS